MIFKSYLPRTLRGRLIVLPSIAIVIFILLSGVLVGYIQYNYLYKNLIRNSKTLGGEIATTIEKYLLLNDYGEVESIMLRFCKLDPIRELTLVNDEHREMINVSKAADGDCVSNLNSGNQYLQFDEKKIYVEDKNTQFFIVTHPLYNGNKILWLRITISKTEVYSNLWNLFELALTIGLVLIFFLVVMIIKLLHKPLEEIKFLTLFSSRLDDNIGKQIFVTGTIKEIDDLGMSLNRLSSKLYDNQQIMSNQNIQLQNFNNELAEKVENEIAKNREKELMLLRQSRLAALGEMIGYIAHQWRQPLNTMALDIQNIQLSFHLNALTQHEFDESTNSVMSQIYYLSNTIDTFRDIIKNDQIIEPFEITKAIYKSVDIVSASLTQSNISLRFEMDESLILTRATSNSFSQAVINLLNNAKDALNTCEAITDKVISITAYQSKTNAVVVISDNGGGIANEIIDKIFDPYFTTKHQSNGTGLGLYIAKSIIEKEFLGNLQVKTADNSTYVTIQCPLE